MSGRSVLSTAVGAALVAFTASCGDVQDPAPASPLQSPRVATGASPPAHQTPNVGGVTAEDVELVEAFVAFARSPDADSAAAVPFAADRMGLGLADRILVERSVDDLHDPSAWRLRWEAFRGHVGPFSALELAAEERPLEISIGPHPHCASPPMPAPQGLEEARRISFQPTDIDSCLQWWTVDLFVSGDGDVEAVTMDLWEP